MSLHHLMSQPSRKNIHAAVADAGRAAGTPTHFSTPLNEIQPSNHPISGRNTNPHPPQKNAYHSHASFQDQNTASDASRPGFGAIGDQRKKSGGRAGSSPNSSASSFAPLLVRSPSAFYLVLNLVFRSPSTSE